MDPNRQNRAAGILLAIIGALGALIILWQVIDQLPQVVKAFLIGALLGGLIAGLPACAVIVHLQGRLLSLAQPMSRMPAQPARSVVPYPVPVYMPPANSFGYPPAYPTNTPPQGYVLPEAEDAPPSWTEM